MYHVLHANAWILVEAVPVLIPAAGPLGASLVTILLPMWTLEAVGSTDLANRSFFAGGFWNLASDWRV